MNTIAIPTTGKSCSLYWELFQLILEIPLASIGKLPLIGKLPIEALQDLPVVGIATVFTLASIVLYIYTFTVFYVL